MCAQDAVAPPFHASSLVPLVPPVSLKVSTKVSRRLRETDRARILQCWSNQNYEPELAATIHVVHDTIVKDGSRYSALRDPAYISGWQRGSAVSTAR